MRALTSTPYIFFQFLSIIIYKNNELLVDLLITKDEVDTLFYKVSYLYIGAQNF